MNKLTIIVYFVCLLTSVPEVIASPVNGCRFQHIPKVLQLEAFSFLAEPNLFKIQSTGRDFGELGSEWLSTYYPNTAIPINGEKKTSAQTFASATHPLVAIDLVSSLLGVKFYPVTAATVIPFPATAQARADGSPVDPAALELTTQRISQLTESLKEGTLPRLFLEGLGEYLNLQGSPTSEKLRDVLRRYEVLAAEGNHPAQELVAFSYTYGIGSASDVVKARTYAESARFFCSYPRYQNTKITEEKQEEKGEPSKQVPAPEKRKPYLLRAFSKFDYIDLKNQLAQTKVRGISAKIWAKIAKNPYSDIDGKRRAETVNYDAKNYAIAAEIADDILLDPRSDLQDKRNAAASHRDNKNYVKAAKLYDEILATPGATVDDKQNAAGTHRENKNYLRAVQLYDEVLATPGATVNDKRRAAVAHRLNKSYAKALKLFEEVLADPGVTLVDKRNAAVTHHDAQSCLRSAKLWDEILADSSHTFQDKKAAAAVHRKNKNHVRAAEIGESIIKHSNATLLDKRYAMADHYFSQNFAMAAEIGELIIKDAFHILQDKRNVAQAQANNESFERAAQIYDAVLLDASSTLEDKRNAALDHYKNKNFKRSAELMDELLLPRWNLPNQ